MRRYRNLISIFIIMITMFSCGPKKLSVGYSNTCFNAENEIVYIKTHSYKYTDLTMMADGASIDSYLYICKMNLLGNEKIIDVVQESGIIFSEGNGKYCLQGGSYDAYTYVDGEFKEVLSGQIYDTRISFDGEKLAYVRKENDTYILCISDVNGTSEKTFGFGSNPSWLPDSNRLVYTVVDYPDWYYYILDTTTSNTQAIPYAYKWSHDEQRIAYYDETDHLVLMNWDETGKITTTWIDDDRQIEWSYDGEYLLSGFDLLDKNGNYIRTLREEN